MATKTDIELKIVDSVDTSHSVAEVLADSTSNPEAFYVGRGYLAKGGEKVIENIDEKGTYPNVTVGNATKATTADTATRANTAATAATAVNISDAPVLTATEDEQITVKVGNKTSNALTVPYAQRADFATDLSGRVEATPEVFTYRPSAGDKSIKDDNAFIRRVKGNSVVWNQLVNGSAYSNTQTRYGLQCSVTSNSREIRVVGTYVGDTSVSDRNWYTAGALTYYSTGIVGHKYLCHIYGNKECSLTVYGWCSNSTDIFDSIIKECTANTNLTIALKLPLVADGTQIDETIIIDIHDLTQMFGAGNEPTTVEEFRALYPDSYYPYNAGELRNLNCYGIKTVGFNQWDEQWEVGYLKADGTTAGYVQNYIRAKNYIPVIGGAMYYASIPDGTSDAQLFAVDENYNLIEHIHSWVNSQFFIPDGAAYIRFYMNYGSEVYDNDICINLHHTGYRDGEYEPYKEVNHSLPLSKITNGEPLRKAGSVYDEINETEYIRRVGVVDLGSYDWYETPNGTFNTVVNIPDIIAVELESNYTCKKYIGVGNPSTIYAGTADNLTISTNAAGRIYIRDDAYKTGTAYAAVPALKASLAGVLLHYELAEPVVKPIETPIDFNYYVEDFGTEEALLAEDSAPFSADIVYQFNATDQVRNNTRNIQRLQKSVFTPSGTTAQYIRGDGSYADVSTLSKVIPIYNGEPDSPDGSDYSIEFGLFPQEYAKASEILDGDSTVLVRINAPDNADTVAEYWFELTIDETTPSITFQDPSNENAVFRFNGQILRNAVNIWHIISTDGGIKYFGEIKNYVI